MTIWEKRQRGVISTLKRGRCSRAAIQSDNTTLLPSPGICQEVVSQLMDSGAVTKIQTGPTTYEYALIDKFIMPFPSNPPEIIPQVQMYELGR